MAKSTIVLCADTHLGFDQPVRPRTERRRRGQDFFDNFRRILDHAIQIRADLVVHGGDLFFRSRLPESIINRAYDLLFQFAASGIPILIVPGNHERSQLPPSLFLSHPAIHVFHQPEVKLFDSAVGRLAFAGFPCVRNGIREQLLSRLSEARWEQMEAACRFLCLHQSVEGAAVGPNDFMFRPHSDVISPLQIPDAFDALLCGHIHRRQILTKERPDGSRLPIVYPGSIERTSFAEQAEVKGYYLITISKDDSAIRRRLDFEFVALPTRPMVDLVVDVGWNEGNLEQRLAAEIATLAPDSIVRLNAAETVPQSVRQLFSSKLLRSRFPATMNVQFSGRFFFQQEHQ